MRILIAILTLTLSMSVQAIPSLGTVMGSTRVEVDTGDEMFALTDTSGVSDDASAFLLLELAGNANFNSFGIYGVGGTSLEIFSGTESAITSATLLWDIGTDTVTLAGTASSAIIDEAIFGFYLDTRSDGRLFSQDSLNNQDDLMLVFEVGGLGYSELFGSNLILAFEDTLGGDLDYNDFVVGISDIAPVGDITTRTVPEPTLPLLLGIGLVGMGFIRKTA